MHRRHLDRAPGCRHARTVTVRQHRDVDVDVRCGDLSGDAEAGVATDEGSGQSGIRQIDSHVEVEREPALERNRFVGTDLQQVSRTGQIGQRSKCAQVEVQVDGFIYGARKINLKHEGVGLERQVEDRGNARQNLVECGL